MIFGNLVINQKGLLASGNTWIGKWELDGVEDIVELRSSRGYFEGGIYDLRGSLRVKCHLRKSNSAWDALLGRHEWELSDTENLIGKARTRGASVGYSVDSKRWCMIHRYDVQQSTVDLGYKVDARRKVIEFSVGVASDLYPALFCFWIIGYTHFIESS
jgi:hypothetical protein